MPLFYVKAFPNEALIFESLGAPISVVKSWSIVPFPCCQRTKRFYVGESKIKFEGGAVVTKDEKVVSVTLTATFVIDSSSKSKILKAYKDLSGIIKSKERSNNDRDKRVTVNDVVNFEGAVTDIVSDCVKTKISNITFDELIGFNSLFMDSVYTKAKYILLKNNVILEELLFEEVKELPESSLPKNEDVFEEKLIRSNSASSKNQNREPRRRQSSLGSAGLTQSNWVTFHNFSRFQRSLSQQ